MPAEPRGAGRTGEVRLLVVTIAISVLALLVLARFRFPTDIARPAQVPAAPALERLAARATYDELAAIISDVQRRVSPALISLPLRRDEPLNELPVDANEIGLVPPRRTIALRIESTIAVAPYWPGARLDATRGAANVTVIAVDELRQITVLRVPSGPAALIAEPGDIAVPAYLAVAEPGRGGSALRPVFVSRADAINDARWPARRIALGPLVVQSGSFLFSLRGEWLGLALDTLDGSTLVPAASLAEDATRLQREGSVRRGSLGFSVQSLSPSLSRATGTSAGVVVAYVASNGPAAGLLRVGDVIETLDQEPVTDPAALSARVGAIRAGAQVSLSVIRDGERIPVQLTATGSNGEASPASELGLTVRPVAGAGVEVVVVGFGSVAALAGLRPGDLITDVNGTRPARLADITRAWSTGDRAVVLGVQRAGRPLVLALRSRDAAS